MNSFCVWRMFLFSFWIQVEFMSQINCNNGVFSHLSEEDIQALKDEEDPKCFTRTGDDFTCFFETAENESLDLFYQCPELPRKKCEVFVHGTEEGTFLHVCSFPRTDIFLFTPTEIQVVETTNNTVIYSRTVDVENHFLPKPPFKVSVKANGDVGKLDVSWDTKVSEDLEKEYRIRYSSRKSGEKTIKEKMKYVQLHLEPGEEVEVQVAVKAGFSLGSGHWSSWSKPVRASVPQSADEITLECLTSDLQNVTCHWNESRYEPKNEFKLFYKMSPRQSLNWTECLSDGKTTGVCRFHGDEIGKIKVMLSSTSDTINRTFFSEEFKLIKSIKTAAPVILRGALSKDKLCLDWDAPLPSLSKHLQYEVKTKIKGGEQWSTIMGPETNTCVAVPAGVQFSVQVRAEPTGSMYSGYWSDWSDELTGDVPPDTDMFLMLCIFAPMLIIVFIFICIVLLYRRKLKQYFWPPVPNLEKVLQDFLVDINQQKWGSPIPTKQYFEETMSSVVEALTEGDMKKPSGESSELLSSDGSFSSEEHEDGSSGTEILPDYVTLNKEVAFLCLLENSYVYEQVNVKEGSEVRKELLQKGLCSCTDGSTFSGNNYFNNSYLLVCPSAELNCEISAEKDPGNHNLSLSLS